MAVDVTITRGYRDPNYFSDLNPQSGYAYYGGGQPVAVPAHNQLPGLQGGMAGASSGVGNEYYHLDATEHTRLAALSDQLAYNSDWGLVTNLTLYGNIYFNNEGQGSSIPPFNTRTIYWGSTGDVDTYIYEYTDDELRVACHDTLVMTFESTGVLSSVDLSVAADLKVDTIDEYTSDVGVTVDSLLIKDQNTRIRLCIFKHSFGFSC
jgi:hypothetical protein